MRGVSGSSTTRSSRIDVHRCYCLRVCDDGLRGGAARQATAVVPTSCLYLDRRTFSRVMGPLRELLKRNMAKYEAVMAEVDEG